MDPSKISRLRRTAVFGGRRTAPAEGKPSDMARQTLVGPLGHQCVGLLDVDHTTLFGSVGHDDATLGLNVTMVCRTNLRRWPKLLACSLPPPPLPPCPVPPCLL